MIESRPDHASLLKQSLVAIDRLQSQLAAADASARQPVAVIGMGCRFPGDANDPEKFWELLRDGRDTVTEVPSERWDADEFFDSDPAVLGKAYTRWGAFLKDVGLFDADFFGISPREAVSVDPQHRLLLEVTWEALENAGIAPSSLAGSETGVFIGMTTHDYSLQAARAGVSRFGDAFAASGIVHSIAAGRISYLLGLNGPNLAVDTACSSSLVAMHLAVQSLRRGESETALAGGVNLTLIPEGSILTSRARMMSFDGRCKTFDAAADGYVRGEGCGMLVLKRLADARRDGDPILAVIRGCAINQDGRSSGMSAPNGSAQVRVIRAALEDAGLKPDDIDYVEAHGTGTPLGDPIELHALGDVFGARQDVGRLRVGSVKTNLGHLEAAAGIAGVMKSILAIQNRQVPPHLHLHSASPNIAWERLAIDVPTRLVPWSVPENRVRRAGISSFGFSGTNVHLIIEEAPPIAEPVATGTGAPGLLVLSAKSEDALTAMAERYGDYLGRAEAPPIADVAVQAIRGRSHFPVRMAIVAANAAEAAAKLASAGRERSAKGISRGKATGGNPEVAFLFTGQGAQYAGMAKALYRDQAVFRGVIDQCTALLEPLLDRSLPEVLWPLDEAASVLDDTRYTQPALFAVEYALARLWESHGVVPSVVMGHSVGEYVAACVAGIFSLEDGLRLVAERARLMGSLPAGGAMAALFAPEAAVFEMIGRHGLQLAVAAVNGPENTVVSGAAGEVDAIMGLAASAGTEGQRLKVSHAFHSHLMDPILDEFEAFAATISCSAPSIGLISNLSGQLLGSEIPTPRYWRDHLRGTVRFADSVDTIVREGYRVAVEVGPHPVLSELARRCGPADGGAWIGSLRKGSDDSTTFLEGLGRLYTCGHKPDARMLWGEAPSHRRVVLPTYPFQRQYFWQRLDGHSQARLAQTRRVHPLLGGVIPSPLGLFESEIGTSLQPWLRDHRIAGLVRFPASAFIELMLAAAVEASGGTRCALQDIRIDQPLILPTDDPVLLQSIVARASDGSRDIQLFSRFPQPGQDRTDGAWQLHATGRITVLGDEPPDAMDVDRLREAYAAGKDVPAYYAALAAHGADYGPSFRGITEIRHRDREVLGRIRLPETVAAGAERFFAHPALLDACLQLIGVVIDSDPAHREDHPLYVPVGFDRYASYRTAGSQAWAHVSLQPAPADPAALQADILLLDDAGGVVAELTGVRLRRIARADSGRHGTALAPRDWAFQVDWRPAAVDSPASAGGGRWIVFGEGGELGNRLCATLRDRGVEAQLVVHGDALRLQGPVWTIDSGDRSHYERLFAGHLRPVGTGTAGGAPGSIAPPGIISLWGLDTGVSSLSAKTTVEAFDAIEAGQLRTLGASLALAQALAQASDDVKARLWLVTRGAQSIDRAEPDLVQSPLWGLGGVIASELPGLPAARVDLDPVVRPDEATALASAIFCADAEDRLALRGGQRLVARLVEATLAEHPAAEPARLEIDERGSLSNLALVPFGRVQPGAGEIEIAVRATGLNFRDVLNALGMYPGDAGPLGNECTGIVTAVGEHVRGLCVGDEVISMVDRCFAPFAIAPAALTVRKPSGLTFAEAATIPVTFLTAAYGLLRLSRIGKGDRVLIHAVTGGVGMAAAQIALRAGAEVFGTAGSEQKRALARRLGVHHVSDSRSLSFFDDVMTQTQGEGVDVVLNSLNGDFIPSSLDLLRKDGGRFIEIGKAGIWDSAAVAAKYPHVTYHPLYLGQVAADDPDLIRGLLADILDRFATGDLKPLRLQTYPLALAEDAFRSMGQGMHVGKIVLCPRQDPTPRADATYLITGGLGGLGLTCARWLAEAGARHLVLAGRRGPDEAAEKAIAGMAAKGVQVSVVQADIADPVQARALFEQISTELPPLAGVLHAAGVIDDALIPAQTLDRFRPVLAPKVRGAWNLHVLTASLPLDFFVMFSAGAALLGSPGQSSYAAANSFIDGLAAMRQARGLPALGINWGSWSEVGMAAGVGAEHRRRWSAMGFESISPSDGVTMLGLLLQRGVIAQYAALPLRRARLPGDLAPFYAELAVDAGSAGQADATVDIVARLEKARGEERRQLLVRYLSDQVGKVLALDGQPIDPHRPILEMGMDSLMAMELRNRVQTCLGVPVAVVDLLAGGTVDQLASKLLDGLPPGESRSGPSEIRGRLQPIGVVESVAAAGAGPADETWEEGSL